MRKIELTATQMETGEIFDYRKQLIDLCRVREKGMDFSQVELAVACIAALRKANVYVRFEESEYEYVLARIEETRWVIADPAVVEFVKTIRAAQKYEANEPEPQAEGSLLAAPERKIKSKKSGGEDKVTAAPPAM